MWNRAGHTHNRAANEKNGMIKAPLWPVVWLTQHDFVLLVSYWLRQMNLLDRNAWKEALDWPGGF